MKQHLYDTLITIVIILKVCFLVIAMLSGLSYLLQWNSKTIEFINTLKDEALTVSEVFMYLVLVIVFYPRRRVKDIKIGKEEQVIAFVLGILGIFHTKWNMFKGFFIDINSLISK